MQASELERYFGDRVQGLKEYAPEPLEEVAQRLEMPVGQLIKLDANENPYGPNSRATAVLSGHINYHRYPDPISRQLRQAIGQHIDVPAQQIMVGNGSDELIDVILKLFRPGLAGGGIAQIIDCQPTFGMYAFYGATNDMDVLNVPRLDDFSLDMERIVALCEDDPTPKVLFATSPNNPDGTLLPDTDLERLLSLPLVVILDEAYIEFAAASRVSWVARYDNLIVLRTFSKWAGLAGLRVGYGVFPESIIAALWKLKSPYNVNGAAQAAALATLEGIDESRATIDKIVAERERFFSKLQEIPYLTPHESQGNYILCQVSGVDMGALKSAMEQRGIILRYYGSGRLENCVRITVGTPMQDEAVLMVLRGLVQE